MGLKSPNKGFKSPNRENGRTVNKSIFQGQLLHRHRLSGKKIKIKKIRVGKCFNKNWRTLHPENKHTQLSLSLYFLSLLLILSLSSGLNSLSLSLYLYFPDYRRRNYLLDWGKKKVFLTGAHSPFIFRSNLWFLFLFLMIVNLPFFFFFYLFVFFVFLNFFFIFEVIGTTCFDFARTRSAEPSRWGISWFVFVYMYLYLYLYTYMWI